jgi:hypothetical protein
LTPPGPALASAFRIDAIELRPQRGSLDNLAVSRRFIRHFGWVVLARHQHFKHTTPLAYSSAMIRFISLNLSVSESMTALALRLLSIQTGKLNMATQKGDFSWL